MSQTLSEVRPARVAWADGLKVWLVVGVIVAHAVMAWTALEGWVLEEPPVREPLLSTLRLAALVGSLFGMAVFFLVAGVFTPRSLARKGPGRYVRDRLLRLGVPLVVYLLLMAPVVEFVDAQNNAGWDRGFLAFVPYSWAHHAPGPWAPGPLWFLEVLLLFSLGYALVRTLRPARPAAPAPLTPRILVAAGGLVALASFVIRLGLPLGQELSGVPPLNDLYFAQAPMWTAGFVLGVLAGERGWLDQMSATMSVLLFRVAWGSVLAVVLIAVGGTLLGADLEVFFGGGTWQSLALALPEAAIVVTMSLWLVDVFRRRVHAQGRLMRQMGRAAFAAFLVHQIVLVGTVLATRWVDWPPEVELVAAAAVAVAGSFGLGALLVRLPGVRRIV